MKHTKIDRIKDVIMNGCNSDESVREQVYAIRKIIIE